MLPANRNVVVAIDDSDYAEFAFDCKSILLIINTVYDKYDSVTTI